MKNIQIKDIHIQDLLKNFAQEQRLSDALELLNGISRLPLESNPELAQKIKEIYGQAKKNEKK